MTSYASRECMSSDSFKAGAAFGFLLLVVLLLGVACADFGRGGAIGSNGSDGGAPDAAAGFGGGSGSSYGVDIGPLLLDGCAACHSATGAASSTGFVLTGNVPDDYQSTLDFVDVGAPDQSRLIVKMEGRGHTGGAIYTRASPERAQLVRWIGEGAAP
jgi:hypothetical protein